MRPGVGRQNHADVSTCSVEDFEPGTGSAQKIWHASLLFCQVLKQKVVATVRKVFVV
jgi:hypothetical protein